ncbi:ubiquitin carboxyl-terminal hydrolase 49 isoform X3 [Heterocephalus glaber]|uniref:Ubiquitin carboxyl-terminal hydrolase n=1 Tax=Heterocephalus glaber TaxID=10181 RepID=A0AAX6T4Q4_HETGA|nr:ubiquitin carboxyl-terminal hydrolase 49 isoform X3 [Heterocephalus glaber]
MDRCKHVGRLRLAQDHSILNPQKWRCLECATTESVWACLKCSHVACGRYIEDHAREHFVETGHPLAMEVRDLYVFCYLCQDYVLNDNPEGDLKLLRSSLLAVRGQQQDQPVRRGRTLRSTATAPGEDAAPPPRTPRGQPQMLAALWHRRQRLLARTLRLWFERSSRGRAKLEQRRREEARERSREAAQARRREEKRRLLEELASAPPRKSARLLLHAPRPAAPAPPAPAVLKPRRQPATAPGVTGLRNLGNTCYMNSILQVLSHLRKFRECFLNLDPCTTEHLFAQAAHRKARLSAPEPQARSDRAEACRRDGLCWNGGVSLSRSLELIQNKEPNSKHISLCHELHTLFRVMWSGRWALVSPFAMLHSVWSLIPAFRGYDQQDAQEFLCELLHKVQQELEAEGSTRRILIPFSQRKLTKQVLKVVNTIFHGQLLSQVTCISCNYKSNTIEPFWDLSLEFPERYHCIEKGFVPLNQTECLLTEMLAKFTETEALEGRIYACDQCNIPGIKLRTLSLQGKRRKSNPKPLVLSEARKQLMIYTLPQVLRLHLKRFRWSGRNHREKIGVHVAFEQVLTMEPYCCRDMLSSLDKETFAYDLSAVVMHHGKGFGSGHYTAYCYNTEGGFWVHCNDSKLNVCSVEEIVAFAVDFFCDELYHGTYQTALRHGGNSDRKWLTLIGKE